MQKIITLSILIAKVWSWPGMLVDLEVSSEAHHRHQKHSKSLKDKCIPDDCIPTGNVHNNCDKCRDPKDYVPRPTGIHYPEAFIMAYEQYQVFVTNMSDHTTTPPYFPNASAAMGHKFKIVTGSGFTYYNATYLGGAQVENYTQRCIPIFPFYDVDFPCTFFLIKEYNKAFLYTEGAPEEFDECCVFAYDFHPPVRNFTDNMDFYGVKKFGHREYLNMGVYYYPGAGNFSYNFWNEPKLDSQGITYYEPSFFYFQGIVPNPKNINRPISIWVDQQFFNFTTEPFDPKLHFTLPNSCLRDNLKACPWQDKPPKTKVNQPKASEDL